MSTTRVLEFGITTSEITCDIHMSLAESETPKILPSHTMHKPLKPEKLRMGIASILDFCT